MKNDKVNQHSPGIIISQSNDPKNEMEEKIRKSFKSFREQEGFKVFSDLIKSLSKK